MIVMSVPQWNSEETKDIEKFIKFFALKSSQIIIGSRLGEKQHTNCKAHIAGTDWFNLSIAERPDVAAEVKRTLSGEQITGTAALCVEISLKTVDGDTMVLEAWKLGMTSEECDPTVRVTYTYNRLALLLKSLLTVTRVIPAYKISRRQNPDSYVLNYRIYLGEPQLHHLGEGHKNVKVGQVSTPLGTIFLAVSYRTKMTISPQSTGHNKSIILKSDHFLPDITSKTKNKLNNEFNVSMTETLKMPAFADVTESNLDDRLILPEIPFSSLIAPRLSPPSKSASMQETLKKSKSDSETDDSDLDGNGNITPRIINKEESYGGRWQESIHRTHSRTNSRTNSRTDSRRSSCSFTSTDDFIMVDLKTPFANANESADLGLFYREVQTAPPLHAFEEAQPLKKTVSDLESQLRDFELAVPTFEKLVHTLSIADD